MSRTRLTMPLCFRSERQALGVVRDNSLFNIGAQVVEVEDPRLRWRIVIDTGKPDAVLRYLSQNGAMSGGPDWLRSDLP